MVIELQNLQADFGALREAKTVLIASGAGDDAFYYYAELGPFIAPSSLIVYFHGESRLLERVRLFGCAKVEISSCDKGGYAGELRPYKGADQRLEAHRVALVLNLFEPMNGVLPNELPITLIT